MGLSTFETIVFLVLVVAGMAWFVTRPKAEDSPPLPPDEPRAKKKAPKAASRGTATRQGKVFVEEVLPGELVVRIYTHEMDGPEGPVPCWTYVSDGLWSRGQKEIVFTVVRRKGEADDAYPPELLGLYGTFYQLASEKRLVDVGDYSLLGTDTPLVGRGKTMGVVYTQPQIYPGIRIPAPSLTALIVTGEEQAVASEFGVVRLMTTLGKRYRYFPTAPWVDRDRPALCSPETMEDSFLTKLPRLRVMGASVRRLSRPASRTEREGPGGLVDQTVTLGESGIVLQLRPGAARALKAIETLPPETPMALLVGPDPSADACFEWVPGQTAPSAIGKPNVSGSCVAANFLAFVPQQAEDGAATIEDGFAVLLRDETWKQMRKALAAGESFSVRATDKEKMDLSIVWAPELDPDFADPLESHMPGGWAAFGPSDEPMTADGPPLVKNLAFLTVSEVMERRVESEPLATYTKALLDEVTSFFEDDETAGDMYIQCEVRPDGTTSFRFGVRPEDAAGSLDELEKHLLRVPPPEVVLGPIRFQMNLRLGAAEEPAVAPPVLH
ncbi:hypothetical protein [Polyangium sp. 15x6]|uniref:hypothetical protein n=1 Tax=Polyangium sp. 15x6 TaxID=3042687 RepID=UPI00249B4C6D|nr:hypothetical protein [Polyangium sp. 15x6]MDI3282649.1 hypothetical protein [Polyangium sp. 15x6]